MNKVLLKIKVEEDSELEKIFLAATNKTYESDVLHFYRNIINHEIRCG